MAERTLAVLCVLALACASPEGVEPEPDGFVRCEEPRPQICTREYRPVCAKSDYAADRTAGNACTACSEAAVAGYVDGDCVPPFASGSTPPYRPIANARQTMLWILDPAADAIWDSAGFVITAEGETDLSPTTQEGWEHVRNNAAVVAETGNLLMMPGRASGSDWIAYSERLIGAAEGAMAAAEAQDADALFDAGGELYQACRACHDQFMVPILEARRAAERNRE